jgi:Uma2 family endonuclease
VVIAWAENALKHGTIRAKGILMSAVPQALLTPEQYLVQERRAEFKSEFYRGEVFAMAGATFEHTLIKDNIARKAGNQLEDASCVVLTSDIRVKVNATGLYTYPDIVIVCDKPQFEDDHFDTLLNPRGIIEVLSDSTEKYDRGKKFAHYRQIATLREYVLVAQDRFLVERYARQDDQTWVLAVFDDITRTFEAATVPVRIPLTEIYRGVTLPEHPGR